MISYSNLDITDHQIIQPNYLAVELMQHQKTAIHAMKDLENKGYVDIKFRYYDNEEKNLRIDTCVGILGDRVGSGKTLMIICLLLDQSKPIDRPVYFASDRYTTIKDITTHDSKIDRSNINVIMVPSGIQHQWEDTIKNSTKNVKHPVKFISHRDRSTADHLTTDDLTSVLIIILCNERSIHDIIKIYGDKKWSRFIIDEADNIQFALLDKIKASFLWLVTGTTNGIQYSKKKYIKEIFGKNLTWQPDFLLIKNKNEYIDMSIELPRPNRIVIDCLTPPEVRLLAEHIPKNVMNMINAGNTDNAIKTLNCHVDTSDNIFKVISRNYEMAIKNKEIELAGEKKKKYTKTEKSEKKFCEHEKRIKKLQNVIKKLQNKLASMKKTLYEVNDEVCPICMNDFFKPTLVDCCAHKYCFDCLALTLNNTYNKCPVCQTKITKNKMHIVSEKENNKQKQKLDKKEKINELVDIVSRNAKGKFLIFADYDETFNKIEKILTSNRIKYGILKGSSNKIKTTVVDFQKGKINVIMLNAKNFGAGMNLQCATDVIMYHRFTKEMEEQIIGRAQRFGRTGTLNVYYLIHENENDSFVDEHFNDMTHQEYLERMDRDTDF
jgi:SNF2 family DNA or RNA helicase